YLPWETVWAALSARLPAGHPLLQDAARFRSELKAIARQGYAVSHSEVEQGVTSVSVPRCGPGGEVQASLSIVDPSLPVAGGGWWVRLPAGHPLLLEGARLRIELKAIGRQCYAVSGSDVEQGVTSVSVPLCGPGGEVQASLSIVGPSLRVAGDGWRRWLDLR